MTTTQVVPLGWKRGVEDLYPTNMDASLEWGDYDKATSGDFISGMVVAIKPGTGNEVAKASGGRFRGIMFTENSAELDESLGGSKPTVITGSALLRVRTRALLATEPYAPGDFLTSGTGANAGRLVRATMTGATPTPAHAIVGEIQEVHADGIIFRLHAPK